MGRCFSFEKASRCTCNRYSHIWFYRISVSQPEAVPPLNRVGKVTLAEHFLMIKHKWHETFWQKWSNTQPQTHTHTGFVSFVIYTYWIICRLMLKLGSFWFHFSLILLRSFCYFVLCSSSYVQPLLHMDVYKSIHSPASHKMHTGHSCIIDKSWVLTAFRHIQRDSDVGGTEAKWCQATDVSGMQSANPYSSALTHITPLNLHQTST